MIVVVNEISTDLMKEGTQVDRQTDIINIERGNLPNVHLPVLTNLMRFRFL